MLAKAKAFSTAHPRLTAWIALAIGMVVILIIAARDVGLLWNQWLFLILATIGLAGLCVWIIGWEANSDDEATATSNPTPKQFQPTGNPPTSKPPSTMKVEAKENVSTEK